MSDSSDSDYDEDKDVKQEPEDGEESEGRSADEHEGDKIDEDVEEEPSKKSLKRKLPSEDEDEEEEEEEEEEEVDEDEDDDDDEGDSRGRKHKKKKKRRTGVHQFILDDVEVDDDEEDVSEYEEDGDEMGIDPREREEAERLMKEQDERNREGRRRDIFSGMNEDQIEDYFKKKYATQTNYTGNEDDDMGMDDISRHCLMPCTKDPNLWIVRCRLGEEKLVALQLMRKYLAHEHTDTPLQIKSVVVKEGLKGIIYIEAYKQTHVSQAIEGISALNPYKITMVPIKEMCDSLRVVKDIPTLKSGMYVRMKRSMYKDDLAQVDWVDIAHNKVYLKLVPRIDYTRMRGALRAPDEPRFVKMKRRPQPRLFDIERIKEIGGEVTTDGDFQIFEGQQFRRGFLYKWFPLNIIQVDGVKPSLSELEKFQETSDDLKKELEGTKIKDRQYSFAPGDYVEVADGELVNLRGRVQSLDGDKVVVLPDHEDLKEPLTLNASELKKYFKAGDHVKVINGRYEGDTGLIVRVEENLVILLSDLTMDELKVLPRDVQLCADVTTGVDSLGQFQYQDLVMLDQQTAGVIVRLEKEYLEVLNMHGKVVRVKPQAIRARRNNRYAQALDSQQNSIQAGDTVKIIDGPHAPRLDGEDEKQGEIKHLFRSFAFIMSRKHTDNGGIFVCKPRHLLLVGAQSSDNNDSFRRGILDSPNPFASPRPAGSQTPVQGGNMSSGRSMRGGQTPSQHGGSSFGGGHIGNARVRRDNHIIGKSVRITHGPLKGYYGIVKDATDQTARVELHANCKTISVDRSRILIVGDGTPGGAPMATVYSKTPTQGEGRTPLYNTSGAKTPMYGSQTPMYGSQTPMHGSQTPMYEGGRTPHYGAATPSYDGGRTPTHSSAWDPSVPNTPADTMDDIHYDEPDSPFDVPTPGSLNPQTPGQPFTPMTPGGMYADYAAPSPYSRSNSTHEGGVYSGQPKTPASVASGGIPQHILNSGEWVSLDMIVQFRDSYDEEELRGQEGTVRSINASEGRCTVYSFEQDREFGAYFDQILPVQPQQGDRVKVIHGDDNGVVGTLVSVDNTEAVIKTDSNEIVLSHIESLCRMENL
ncbi:hypothetical protein AB6A40_000100 [Gnathostoma spinigerum]|uniref:Transcription elongation factor SPT5 n=1 Tax=Gnathostoma spinigerum TaxID=75299 RepID=A0ABD6E7P5_9BILA